MASSTVTKQMAYMRLNNGTTEAGAVRVVSVSLGQMDANAWDADKALAIVKKLKNCLSKSLYVLEGVQTTAYSESV